MTIVLVFISTMCSWLYKEVTAWLQLVGSLAGVMLAFSIPALCFYMVYKDKKGFGLKSKLVGAWGVIVTITGLTASVVLILIMAKVLKIDD